MENFDFFVVKKKSVVYPVAFVAYVLLSLLLYWVWQGEVTLRMLIGTCIIGVVILLLSEISIRVLGKKLKHSERNVENVPAKNRIVQRILRNALMYVAIVGTVLIFYLVFGIAVTTDKVWSVMIVGLAVLLGYSMNDYYAYRR